MDINQVKRCSKKGRPQQSYEISLVPLKPIKKYHHVGLYSDMKRA